VPIVIFSHSDKENVGPLTPAKLATYLRGKGERVVTGSRAINPKTGSLITLYSWAPSKKFISKYNKYHKKNKKNANKGGADAY